MDYSWVIIIVVGLVLGIGIRSLKNKNKIKMPKIRKQKHTEEDDRNKLYGCTICTRWFTSIGDLQEHSLNDHKTVVSVHDANYRAKVVDDEAYQETLLQEAERTQLEMELEEAQEERIEAKLMQEHIMDRAVVIQDGATPASICAQIISKLQDADIEKEFNGSIQTTVRGNQIYFRAELILPHSEHNLNSITQFAGAVRR